MVTIKIDIVPEGLQFTDFSIFFLYKIDSTATVGRQRKNDLSVEIVPEA